MRRPYLITVDRDAIDRGDDRAIRVESPTGLVTHHERVVLGDKSVIVSGLPRRDGARVWIETNDVIV